MSMKLYATPRSHFSRKVRLLLDHLGVSFDLIDIGNVAENSLECFHGNPNMSVPILVDGDTWLIESDHIAGYISQRFDLRDRYAVFTNDLERLNARAIMNGAMANEAKLLLSARTGLNPDGFAYFDKAKSSIVRSFEWLEDRHQLFTPVNPTYLDFHLICLWEHVRLFEIVDLNYARLADITEELGRQDLIRASTPPPPIV